MIRDNFVKMLSFLMRQTSVLAKFVNDVMNPMLISKTSSFFQSQTSLQVDPTIKTRQESSKTLTLNISRYVIAISQSRHQQEICENLDSSTLRIVASKQRTAPCDSSFRKIIFLFLSVLRECFCKTPGQHRPHPTGSFS